MPFRLQRLGYGTFQRKGCFSMSVVRKYLLGLFDTKARIKHLKNQQRTAVQGEEPLWNPSSPFGGGNFNIGFSNRLIGF